MIPLAANDPRRLALESDGIVPVLLVAVNFAAPQRVTDAGRNVTVGGSTYYSGRGLVGITTPSLQEGVSRGSLELTFADDDPASPMSWARRFAGTPKPSVRVQVAFFHAGALTAALDVYSGRWGGFARRAAEGEGVLTVARFNGEFAAIDDTAAVMTTPEDQRRRDASDTALKFVHRTVELVWGRDPA